MTISEITAKMIDFYQGNLHDINHFMKVYAYAKTIGECEHLDAETQMLLEVAAIVHDIACPLCREKYGNANGKLQEQEGPALTAEFLRDSGLTQSQIDRVVYLVGHHHTLNGIHGPDYQILIEADYLVNADENHFTKENIQNTLKNVFQTATGRRILKSIYSVTG